MSEGWPYNNGDLSEETRAMINNHQIAVFNLLDEIARPNHVPRKYRDDHLIRGLRNMMIDFQLSGNDDYAETTMLAIEALGGNPKSD